MNRKFKGMMIAGGTLAMLATLIPMASYAVTTDSKTANVSVKVSPYITIDAVTSATIGGDDGVTPNTLATGAFSATVTANKGYTLSLHATKTDLTSTESTDVIPAIANGGTSNLPSNATAWGVQKYADAQASNGIYTGLTTSPVEFYSSATGGADMKTEFNVGIMVLPSIASGTYSTDVTITANTATN